MEKLIDKKIEQRNKTAMIKKEFVVDSGSRFESLSKNPVTVKPFMSTSSFQIETDDPTTSLTQDTEKIRKLIFKNSGNECQRNESNVFESHVFSKDTVNSPLLLYQTSDTPQRPMRIASSLTLSPHILMSFRKQ